MEFVLAGPKRSKVQIESDRAEIARYYLQGKIQAEIAAKLGMTQQMVSYDLKAIRAAWQKSALVDFDEIIGRELAKIDQLERTWWTAWERSTQVKESSSTKVIDDGSGERNEASVKQEQLIGDPRFLHGVQWCIEKRIDIFGLKAPIRIDWREELPEDLEPDEVQRQFTQLMVAAADADYTQTG